MINCQLVSNKMRMVKIIPGVLAPSTVQQREPRGNKRGKVELMVIILWNLYCTQSQHYCLIWFGKLALH